MSYQFNPLSGQFESKAVSDKLQVMVTPRLIAQNLTIPPGCDALSITPPAIQSGVVVEIGAGSVWSFLFPTHL